MKKYGVILGVAGTLWLASCHPNDPMPNRNGSSTNANSSAPLLPVTIDQFRNKVAEMDAKQVLAEATAEFGDPTRILGSGFRIPQWDIAGGKLTVHPTVGPTFEDATGKSFWLIPTHNPAGENVMQGFEMTTLPDPENNGTMHWLGNVSFAENGTYRFRESQQSGTLRIDRDNNLFFKYPEGRVEVIWSAGVNEQSDLETLGDRKIAELRFSSEDGKATLSCNVISSVEYHRLSIISASFHMGASWVHFWLNDGDTPDNR